MKRLVIRWCHALQHIRHTLDGGEAISSVCSPGGNQSNAFYERTMHQGLVRRRSRNISHLGMCVFRTLTCLHRTDSRPRPRHIARNIHCLLRTARLIRTPCFLVFSVNPRITRHTLWKRRGGAVNIEKETDFSLFSPIDPQFSLLSAYPGTGWFLPNFLHTRFYVAIMVVAARTLVTRTK